VSTGARLVEDEAALRLLNERYFHALDRRDFGLLAECFSRTATASYLGGQWQLEGRDAVVARLEVVLRFSSTLHTLASMSIDLEGDDTASGHVLAIAYLSTSDAPGGRIIVRGLHYRDGYTRAEGSWRIQTREQVPLWQFEADAVPPILPAGPATRDEP
jgi:hypothetical protein